MLRGQGEAISLRSLRSLRDALNDVLDDGGINVGDSPIKYTATATSISTTIGSAAGAQVLHDPHLMTLIIGWLFHERHTLASRLALGQAALMSREWRHISRQTCFWRPLVRELMPVVGDCEESMVQGRGYEGYFACLAQYGKCLVEKRVKTGEGDVLENLEMHVEVWDAGVVSARIYSAMGSIRTTIVQGTTPEDPLTVILRISGPHRKEVAGPAFSAADRDPVQRRFPTIVDCFQASHLLDNPLHLCMRVMVSDRQTGNMALVWESGKTMKYDVTSCAEWVSDYVPGIAYFVRSAGWTALRRCQADGSWSSGEEELSAYAGFLLQALPNQEGVDETEKKFVAATLPTFHSSFADLHFNMPDAKTVASFLRSLLK